MNARVLAELLPHKPRSSLVIALLTVDEKGYPNVCLLSPFQVVAKDSSTILFEVYSGSKTQVNLWKRKRATLVIFLPPAAYYVKGTAKRLTLPERASERGGNVLHRFDVIQVTRDYYRRAPITSAVTFDQSRILRDYTDVYQGLVEAVSKPQ